MKLDIQFRQLVHLVNQMGAPLVVWRAGSTKISELELNQLRTKRGLELSDINEVVPNDNGLLTYKGEAVILYIRDVQIDKYTVLNKPEETRRFHMFDCDTIGYMRRVNRFERFRVTNDTSGTFLVDAYESKHSQRLEEIEAKLLVCKNCFAGLRYKGYKKPSGIPKHIWKSFNIEEFLKTYTPTFRRRPKYTDKVGPGSDYPKDWNQISQKVRSNVGWRCKGCNVYLGTYHHRKLLHVHHRDGNKGNISALNLIALCLECHAREPFGSLILHPNKVGLRMLKLIKGEQGITSERRRNDDKDQADRTISEHQRDDDIEWVNRMGASFLLKLYYWAKPLNHFQNQQSELLAIYWAAKDFRKGKGMTPTKARLVRRIYERAVSKGFAI